MNIKFKIILFPIINLILLVTNLYSQVDIEIREPGRNGINQNDLWNITLINNTRNSLKVYIYSNLNESKEGKILECISKLIEIKPGKNIIENNISIKAIVNFFKPDFKNLYYSNKDFPEGSYNYNVYIKDRDENTISSKTLVHNILNEEEIERTLILLTPGNRDTVSVEAINFSWDFKSNEYQDKDVVYEMKAVKYFKGQNINEAMKNNPTVYGATLKTNSVAIPVSILWQNFTELNQAHPIIWQVTATYNQQQIEQSSIWKFYLSQPRELNQYRIYCNCDSGYIIGPNQVINGDFSEGNKGFNSGLTYTENKPVIPSGLYYIGRNAHEAHPNWLGISRNSAIHGNIMMCNGSTIETNNCAWQQKIKIEKDRNYIFCIWLINLYSDETGVGISNPPIIELKINGNPVSEKKELPYAPYYWYNLSGKWNSGEDTTALLEIWNLSTMEIGNDFGINEIEFRKCISEKEFNSCNCVNWFPPTVYYLGNLYKGSEGETISVESFAANAKIKVKTELKCTPSNTCFPDYKWSISPSADVIGKSEGNNLPVEFIPRFGNSVYTITIEGQCNNIPCKPFQIMVKTGIQEE